MCVHGAFGIHHRGLSSVTDKKKIMGVIVHSVRTTHAYTFIEKISGGERTNLNGEKIVGR